MRFYRLLFLCLFSLAALTGCMSLPQDVALESYQGRFSVSMTSAHHQANESGRFELGLYPKNHIILDLKTPLGGTIARINKTQEKVQLKALGQEALEAQNIDQLLLTTLGFTIPVDGLSYWIKGQADPSMTSKVRPDQAPFDCIEQNGWTIEIASRNMDQSPKRLRMSRAGTNNEPAITLTLLILGSH